MHIGILEIVGLFLIVAGCSGLVAAAALVSVALAVALGAAFVVLAGILLVYIAVTLEKAAKAAAALKGGGRS